MAPEVVMRIGHSYSADIWSLGCLLIEMISGIPPWSIFSRSAKEVLKLISTPENVPDIPDCSSHLRDLIELCLQRNADFRPSATSLLKHDFFKEENIEDMSTLIN